ncbi:DUF7678 domain-containing protein [Paenibacillus solani]|uniref:DUF7678 domain-containing protein n=1 Tax=Paenibacillus solani TaxID=1705565 RepID=UPI003D2A4E3C
MFVKKNSNGKANRYSAEIDGYLLTVEVMENPSELGISNGRITRLLLFPSNKNERLDEFFVFNQGWIDGLPHPDKVRRVIEKAVHHFDALTIDWSKERKKQQNFVLIGS